MNKGGQDMSVIITFFIILFIWSFIPIKYNLLINFLLAVFAPFIIIGLKFTFVILGELFGLMLKVFENFSYATKELASLFRKKPKNEIISEE